MKGPHPRFTLLGNNSGRNLGDAAIMASIMDVIAEELPNAEFFVPTTHPEFTRKHYGSQYNVKAINVMPWTGSIRLLGIPTLRCIAKSDVAMICDGIIFGKKLFNPTFNFLITLIFLVPWARLCGTKMVCYSCGIGPFPSRISEIFARWVMNGSDLVILRERDSEKLARKIGVTKPIEVTGDAAFLNKVSSPERGAEILQAEGIDSSRKLIGINVTKYFDSWLKPSERIEDKNKFLEELSQGIRGAIDELGEDIQPVIFSTQPMDEPTCFQLAKLLDTKVIHNSTYLSHDIQAVMKKCDLFLGMRFHSLVLASAVEVPIVGLVYAPKVRGYMRLLECEDYSLELASIDADSLKLTTAEAWRKRDEILARQKPVVDELKAGARRAARTVAERYFPGRSMESVPQDVNTSSAAAVGE